MPRPSGMTTHRDLWVSVGLPIENWSASTGLKCVSLSLRVNSFAFILITEESWPLLILRLVSNMVYVTHLKIIPNNLSAYHNNNWFLWQTFWKSLVWPISSKLRGTTTFSTRSCLSKSLNFWVSVQYTSNICFNVPSCIVSLKIKYFLFCEYIYRNVAYYQQPLWLQLHLPRRDNSSLHQWCWRTDGHWCE